MSSDRDVYTFELRIRRVQKITLAVCKKNTSTHAMSKQIKNELTIVKTIPMEMKV